MDIPFFIGLIGSLILVIGAAWPREKVSHPTHSIKNWLFLGGAVFMTIYAIDGYIEGASVFFIFLEAVVILSSLLMMFDIKDEIDFPIISTAGIALIAWSLFLFDGYNTIIFILGLVGVSFGYAFKMGSFRRDLALTLGSILIALFSYLEASWIFFWLNVFFAIFSAYYLLMQKHKKVK